MLTIGHSTHPIEEFVALLNAHDVRQLIDVRTIPKSRRNPQFNRDELAAALKRSKILYKHVPELGGLRHPRKDSINTAWQNASFRGYADYMQTQQFDESLRELMQEAATRRTAIMCAEAVPWRCHRSLIADALAARGVEVEHIMSPTTRKPHSFTPFARIEGQTVTYPGLQPG
ncbi:MAG: DNA repair protein [Acidobacteria bacterium]|nr:MAG: DNA repair protein [Acidobacteriota bacterium]